MNQSIKISHRENLLFSSWNASGKTEENAGQVLSWVSGDLDRPALASCIGEFDTIRFFNSIQIDFHSEFINFFPETFRFEISMDGIVWEPMLHEINFHQGVALMGAWNFPLLAARYVKFLFSVDKTNPDGKYFAAFGNFRAMISGIVKLSTSGELDRLWVKENLIDKRSDYGWSSSLKPEASEEFVQMDLGSINGVSEIRMLSKDDPESFFPVSFRISYSEDGIAWHHLIEENGFLAESGTWYKWRFAPINMQFVKITIDEGAKTREGKYISQIIEIELYAIPDLPDKTEKSQNAEPVPYSSVLRSGIVRLARDGEVKEGVAVQSSDRRLKDGTTETKGIVELASDGEDVPGVAVQGHDRRLRLATEDLPGIVRFARDGEVKANHAVQGNDSRLKTATEENPGLIELASDGETRSGVAVQGNDRRLRFATEADPGIMRFARNGSDAPNEAIQGNDSRLRDATTETKGILRFAMHGEESSLASVQGSDPRLRKATFEYPGIVQLARDGEVKENTAVQSIDSRLKSATEENYGTVKLAPLGSSLSGHVIQTGDPRLSDAREALPHTHNYAPVDHDLSSHKGTLIRKENMGKSYKGIEVPPAQFSPVEGINEGEGSGILGRGRDGVIGSGEKSGVLGMSPGEGAGVLGMSRKGPGGVFYSEKGYSLIAGGSDEDRGLESSEWAFLCKEKSLFKKTLYFNEKGIDSIGRFFPVERADVLTRGDIMIASKSRDGFLEKSRKEGSFRVVGVVVENAALVMNTPEGFEELSLNVTRHKEFALVGFAGVVQIKVSAKGGEILPGDLLVTSDKAGMAQKLNLEKYKPGVVFAKSLGNLKTGEGILPAIMLNA